MVGDPYPCPCPTVECRLSQWGVFLQLSLPPVSISPPATAKHFISLCLQSGTSRGSQQHMKFKFDASCPSVPDPVYYPVNLRCQPPPVADNAIWAFCIASDDDDGDGSMSFYYYFYCAVIFCHPAQWAGVDGNGLGVVGVHINST